MVMSSKTTYQYGKNGRSDDDVVVSLVCGRVDLVDSPLIDDENDENGGDVKSVVVIIVVDYKTSNLLTAVDVKGWTGVVEKKKSKCV